MFGAFLKKNFLQIIFISILMFKKQFIMNSKPIKYIFNCSSKSNSHFKSNNIITPIVLPNI